VATRRVSKNLQQNRFGGEDTGCSGDNTSQKKSGGMVQPQSRVCFRKSFLGQDLVGSINEDLQIRHIFEFKWSKDRVEGFLEVEKAEANEQRKSINGAAAPKREFEQIYFVVGKRRSVVESDFYTMLQKLDVQEGKKDKLFDDHATQACEAHNRVIVSFLQQVQRPCTHQNEKMSGKTDISNPTKSLST